MADFNTSNTAASNDYSQPDNQKRGTGFTNLQKYLQANNNTDPNTGQPGQSNLDQYLGNQISGEGQNFQKNLQGAQNDLQDELNTVGPDLDKQKTEIDSVLTDPTKATDQQVSDFKGWLNPTTPQWTNPQSVNDVQNQARDLSQLGNQFQNGNVQGILQRYGGNGQYGQGQQNFDSMLLGNASGIRSGMQNLNNVNNQVNNAVGGATANLGQRILQSKDAVGNALYGQGGSNSNITGGAVGNTQTDIQNSTDAANAAAKKNYQDLYNSILNGQTKNQWGGTQYNLDPGTFGQLGLNTDASHGGDYHLGNNMNPLSYLTQASAATTGNAATQDQLAKLNALAKLGGVSQSWLDPSQVGTYNPNASFDTSRFTQDSVNALNQEKSAYSDAYNNYMNAINSGDRDAQKMWGDRLTKAQQDAGYYNFITENPTPTASLPVNNAPKTFYKMP